MVADVVDEDLLPFCDGYEGADRRGEGWEVEVVVGIRDAAAAGPLIA